MTLLPPSRLLPAALPLACLCLPSPDLAADPAAGVSSPVGLVATFDGGLTADASGGEPRPAAHHDLAADPGGRSGAGVTLRDRQFLRFQAPGNLSLDAGTLTLWVRPAEALAPGGPAAGPPRQTLFAVDNRLGTRLAAELNQELPGRPRIVLEVGDGERTDRVAVDTGGWPADAWRRVQAAWERPGRAAVRIDDDPWVERDGLPLPTLPVEMAMDLYVGTNASQLDRSPFGPRRRFDGTLDDLTIGPGYRDGSPPEGLVPARVSPPPMDLPWATDTPHRVQLRLEPTADGAPGADLRRPVRARFHPGAGWADHTPAQRRAALRGVRLVRHDPQTGEPVPRPGDAGLFHPFRVEGDAYTDAELDLRFVHRGPLPAVYAFGFDPAAPDSTVAVPAEAVSVGNGDRLRVGAPGEAGILNGGLRGGHAPFDPDGDGDVDFWFSSGDEMGLDDDLVNGHFFLENLGGPGHDAVYAPPVLIRRGHTAAGELKPLHPPQLVDVNGDGRLDCFFYAGEGATQWWSWRFENDRVTVDAVHAMEVPVGRSEPRGRLLDWNGDGTLDLLAGESVFFGRPGEDGVPRFAAEPSLALQIETEAGRDAPRRRIALLPVDFDGDGVRDLLATAWTNAVRLHRGVAGDPAAFGPGERLTTFDGHELAIPSVFPVPRMVDFDADGDADLTWTNDGALLGWCENIADAGRPPALRQTVLLRELDATVQSGCLTIATAADLDGDGDQDLVLGGAGAGVWHAENVGDAEHPVWAESEPLLAGGHPIELRAGADGSLRGSQEIDWGYTNPVVADWDADGLPDLLVSGIRGEVHFFRNAGSRTRPSFASGRRVAFSAGVTDPRTPAWLRYERQGRELIVAHRCRPAVLDWNGDGTLDLLTLDHANRPAVYLARHHPDGPPTVGPPRRDLLEVDGPWLATHIAHHRPLDHPQWRPHYAGRSVFTATDWDGDGDADLLLDGVSARLLENVTGPTADAAGGPVRFVDRGELSPLKLVQHNTGPGVADLTGDGRDDLLIGTQSGRVFFFDRAFLDGQSPRVRASATEDRTPR